MNKCVSQSGKVPEPIWAHDELYKGSRAVAVRSPERRATDEDDKLRMWWRLGAGVRWDGGRARPSTASVQGIRGDSGDDAIAAERVGRRLHSTRWKSRDDRGGGVRGDRSASVSPRRPGTERAVNLISTDLRDGVERPVSGRRLSVVARRADAGRPRPRQVDAVPSDSGTSTPPVCGRRPSPPCRSAQRSGCLPLDAGPTTLS